MTKLPKIGTGLPPLLSGQTTLELGDKSLLSSPRIATRQQGFFTGVAHQILNEVVEGGGQSLQQDMNFNFLNFDASYSFVQGDFRIDSGTNLYKTEFLSSEEVKFLAAKRSQVLSWTPDQNCIKWAKPYVEFSRKFASSKGLLHHEYGTRQVNKPGSGEELHSLRQVMPGETYQFRDLIHSKLSRGELVVRERMRNNGKYIVIAIRGLHMHRLLREKKETFYKSLSLLARLHLNQGNHVTLMMDDYFLPFTDRENLDYLIVAKAMELRHFRLWGTEKINLNRTVTELRKRSAEVHSLFPDIDTYEWNQDQKLQKLLELKRIPCSSVVLNPGKLTKEYQQKKYISDDLEFEVDDEYYDVTSHRELSRESEEQRRRLQKVRGCVLMPEGKDDADALNEYKKLLFFVRGKNVPTPGIEKSVEKIHDKLVHLPTHHSTLALHMNPTANDFDLMFRLEFFRCIVSGNLLFINELWEIVKHFEETHPGTASSFRGEMPYDDSMEQKLEKFLEKQFSTPKDKLGLLCEIIVHPGVDSAGSRAASKVLFKRIEELGGEEKVKTEFYRLMGEPSLSGSSCDYADLIAKNLNIFWELTFLSGPSPDFTRRFQEIAKVLENALSVYFLLNQYRSPSSFNGLIPYLGKRRVWEFEYDYQNNVQTNYTFIVDDNNDTVELWNVEKKPCNANTTSHLESHYKEKKKSKFEGLGLSWLMKQEQDSDTKDKIHKMLGNSSACTGIGVSGACREEKDEINMSRILMEADRDLSPPSNYFPIEISGRFDPVRGGFSKLDGVSHDQFLSGGKNQVKIKSTNPTLIYEAFGRPYLTPFQGKLSRSHENEFTFSLKRSESSMMRDFLDLPIGEFQRMGRKGRVVGGLYAQLTQTTSIAELNIRPEMRDAVTQLLSSLNQMTVRQAIDAISGFVGQYITYGKYTDDEIDEFSRLKELAQHGKLNYADYLSFILNHQKGKCVEISALTAFLMRTAGIPTAMMKCHTASSGRYVTNMGHAVSLVLVKGNGEKFDALPVENAVSAPSLSEDKHIPSVEKKKQEERERERKAHEEEKRRLAEAEKAAKEARLLQQMEEAKKRSFLGLAVDKIRKLTDKKSSKEKNARKEEERRIKATEEEAKKAAALREEAEKEAKRLELLKQLEAERVDQGKGEEEPESEENKRIKAIVAELKGEKVAEDDDYPVIAVEPKEAPSLRQLEWTDLTMQEQHFCLRAKWLLNYMLEFKDRDFTANPKNLTPLNPKELEKIWSKDQLAKSEPLNVPFIITHENYPIIKEWFEFVRNKIPNKILQYIVMTTLRQGL
ncbi:MAG: hypothetical protein ABIE74_02025 [Pseudomonadota bacterium]